VVFATACDVGFRRAKLLAANFGDGHTNRPMMQAFPDHPEQLQAGVQ
jgi:hypothetical protein